MSELHIARRSWLKGMGTIAAAALLAAFGTVPRPSHAARHSSWMRDLQGYDQVLATIGYRLGTANADLCRRRAPSMGLMLQDLSQYAPADQPLARATFDMTTWPLVSAVAIGGPAARAGIAPDDAIVAIAGAYPATVTTKAPTFARVDAVLNQLEQAGATGPVRLTLRRAGADRVVMVDPTPACASRFQTRISDQIDANAAGEDVEVNTGAMQFAGEEVQVAAIAAHELAHNILRVPGSDPARRTVDQVRIDEEQADRLSVYLLDRAGYLPTAALTFWTRYRRTHPLSFLAGGSHDQPGRRIELLRAEIERLTTLKRTGGRLAPDFLPRR